MNEAKHYPKHSAQDLGQDYMNHVMAMTAEGLHSKSDIAVQLAWRDAELRRLSAINAELVDALDVAKQFMSIASDWNFDEAEINGEMKSTYDWIDLIESALEKAKQ